MDIIQAIDAEISRLQQVKALLSDVPAPRGPGRPKASPGSVVKAAKKYVMSAGARARIAAAQKARWAKAKNG